MIRDDVLAQFATLYNRIGEQGYTLPALLNSAPSETESDSDATSEENSDSGSTENRSETVRDMLSVFERSALPQEFGREFPSVPATSASQDLYVPGNLAATIYGVAVRDKLFYRHLRKTVTHDICTSVVFLKQGARAREALRRLDHYVQNGPTEDPRGTDMDVPGCARVLRFTVERICQDRESRAASGPLGSTVIATLAEVLIDILQDVCNRNEDVYRHINWPREGGAAAADNEPESERNLYTYLIGNPPRYGVSAPTWMKDSFVIDRFRSIPVNQWRHLLERLTNILDQIRDNTPEDQDPPLAYTKLERIIQEYTSDAFEPSSSSSMQRRPAVGEQPQSQRRRLL